MLDRDLASAYHVSTAAFNQAVKRNLNRFPEGFRFQLTKEEHAILISQIVTSNGELAESDLEAFGRQYGKLTKSICGICHDRFIIVDGKEIFAVGASLKDAGRQTFGVVRSGSETIPGLLANLRKATIETRTYG